MPENPPEKKIDVTYEQMQGFLEIASSKELMAKELLKYILKSDLPVSDEVMVNICEIFSLATSARKWLLETIEKTGATADTTLRMSASHALTISTIMINIVSICESLKHQNYSLEVH